ncbi:MAG: amidase [Thaumarchaeota archaeon]|nr:amidase [Nitrososphaerota archaeon]
MTEMNSSSDLYLASATELIDLIKNRKITVKEVIESVIDRIQKINPKVDAWVHLDHQQSLQRAIELDEKMKNGVDIGPLYGIPIGIKDIFNTQDFPTEMGSPLWKGFTPGNDARVVHYLRMANATIIGKTETAEFAVHTLGKSKNPYDATRSPGTSSSGSAIAVATFMVPFALGTQTAGSIIRPASFCGVYGFKPSFGLIPRTGMLKTTDSLDQVGYFARTPQDLELLFDIVRVRGRDYPLSEAALNDENRQSIRKRPWRIRFIRTPVWNKAEEYARNLLESFIQTLTQQKDFQVEEFVLPSGFELAHKMHQMIYTRSLSYYFKNELQNRSLVSNIFYEFAAEAKKVSAEQFDEAIEYQNKISHIIDNGFEGFDIIISMSTASHAPLREEKETDDPSLIWTMCRNPTINIPAFKTQAGLPMGLQAVARRYNDKLLLNFVKLIRSMNLIPDSPNPMISF